MCVCVWGGGGGGGKQQSVSDGQWPIRITFRWLANGGPLFDEQGELIHQHQPPTNMSFECRFAGGPVVARF